MYVSGLLIVGGKIVLGAAMLIEEFDEPIQVRADFGGGKITPLKFKWNGRVYDICQVNMRWPERDGRHPKRCFSVQCGDDTYHLVLKTDDLTWRLRKVILIS